MPSPGRIRLAFRLLEISLGGAALVLLALHFVHLTADFPAGTPWMDWAKYTDEGWYGDAAIRLFTFGHWRVPGDFNPAAALPVWPALEVVLFRLTGVSLSAARALSAALFCLVSLTAAALVRDCLRRVSPLISPFAPSAPLRKAIPSTAAAFTLLALASSSFCFAFARLALLEPLLILLGLLALRLSIHLGQAASNRRAVILGLLLVLMVLTKTTGLFLAPSLLLALWAATGWSLRRTLRPAAMALGTATLLWLLYLAFLAHHHLLVDYRYLFNANAYTGITRDTVLPVLHDTLRDMLWIGPAAAIAVLLAIPLLLALPRLRRDPLPPALLLWILGYAAFLAYHDNLQPRYYLVLAVPLLALPPLALGALALSATGPSLFARLRLLAITLGSAALLAIATKESITTVGFLRHATFRYLAAARGIAAIIHDDPHHDPLLLSVSGSDISLMTGIPSIGDDFGTMDLEDRIDLYHPGWYAVWNSVEDDKMDALTPTYHLERVASFPAYDDPERNLLILYRLDTPGQLRALRRRRHHRPIPPHLRIRSGQQPSSVQLQH